MKKLATEFNNEDWILSSNKEYLQSKVLLKHGFRHAFFTKLNKNQNPNDLIKFIPDKCSLHQLKQVHGNIVIEASKAIKAPWPEADGIISSPDKKQSLWIYTADCIPVFFANKKNGQVAAAHAGWRGISKNILKKIFDRLDAFGLNIQDFLVTLGPSISQPHYQVGTDVVLSLYESLKQNSVFSKGIHNKIEIMESHGIIKKDKNKGRLLLDIRSAAIYQLLSIGLRKDQIYKNENCTFREEDLFNSWRRDNVKSMQWNCIISR